MNGLAMDVAAHDPQVLQKRVGAFCHRYPAKVLARVLRCDVRTAENLRQAHWPSGRIYQRLAEAFGVAFLSAVHPHLAAQHIEQENAHLEALILAEELAERSAPALTGASQPPPLALTPSGVRP